MVTGGDLGLRGTAARRMCTAPGADGQTRPALFRPDGTPEPVRLAGRGVKPDGTPDTHAPPGGREIQAEGESL
jgi:hypothetical protein